MIVAKELLVVSYVGKMSILLILLLYKKSLIKIIKIWMIFRKLVQFLIVIKLNRKDKDSQVVSILFLELEWSDFFMQLSCKSRRVIGLFDKFINRASIHLIQFLYIFLIK